MDGVQPQRRVVWIVDDSPLDAERAGRALRAVYQVETFGDGPAALERLSSSPPPDIMVIDWVMPGMSGVEVCRFLVGRGPPPPAILLVTAQNTPEQVVEALEAGASDYLVKPYAETELRARVDTLLRTRALVERAERAEAAVTSLLANAPDPLLAVDRQHLLTFANAAASSMLGAPVEALLGRPLVEVIPEFPVDTLGVAGGQPRLLRDVLLRGQVYAPTVRVLPGDAGAAVTIALRNVTEQRQAEARRLDLYSIVAHDLRSPLNSTLLRTARILRGGYGLLPADLIADVHKIESTLRSQVVLINDFLELARLEAAGYNLTREAVDIQAVVESTIEESRPLIEAGKLTIQTDVPREAVQVLGDRPRLGQVVTNLLGNAIKFTPAGGRLTARISLSEDQVETAIQDTGPGIPQEALPTLFERFTRGRDAQKVVGTGLGLMIVREIVHAHGGTLGVHSQLGQGSTFWFRLPRLR